MKIRLLILISLLPLLSSAQNLNQSKADSLFYLIELHNKGMGSVSLFENGKEVYRKSYGYGDIENNQRINADTKFRIGSITKTFTAALIMKLIEDNFLSLNTPLSTYYPEISNAENITVENMLQHRSGIPNVTGADFLEWNTVKHSKEGLMQRMKGRAPLFNPDERFDYSNSNYILLTWIAEDVTGKSYSYLLEDYIIKPCKLKNTYFGSKINTAKNETLSYTKLVDWNLSSETDMSIPLGAGAIVSTSTDLNKFYYNLFNGKIISSTSLEQMKNMKDGFGFGLIQVPFYDKIGYGHTGGIDGFHSAAYYFPDDQVSVAVTSNALDYPINDIVVALLSLYYNKEYTLPEFKLPKVSDFDLDQYTGVYSTPNLPIKITITRNGQLLIAQGTGQPSFALEYVGGHIYKYDMAKLEIEFVPEKEEMILKQMGGVFQMKKE